MYCYKIDQFKDLIGKKVKFIEKDERILQFNLEDGSLIEFEAIGDCCSKSFIEDMDNPEIFNNSTFISVEVVDGESKENDEFDVHKWSFYKFKTDKGMCTLSFRNESNGYYNGQLEKVDPLNSVRD